MRCFVFGCKNGDKKRLEGVTFHKFPQNRKKEWLQAIKRDPNTFIINQKICSEHFDNNDFYSGQLKLLKPNVIPTVKLQVGPYDAHQSQIVQSTVEQGMVDTECDMGPRNRSTRYIMPHCFVVGCKNSTKKKKEGTTFHLISTKLRSKWLTAIGRSSQHFVIQERVCSDHFHDNDFTCVGSRKHIKENVVPSFNLPSVICKTKTSVIENVNYETTPLQKVLSSHSSSSDSIELQRENSTAVKRSLPIYDEPVYNNTWMARIQNPDVSSIDPQIAGKRYRVYDIHFSDFCRSLGTKRLKFRSVPTLILPGFKDVPTEQNSLYDENRTVQEIPSTEIKDEVEDITEALQTDTTIISISTEENMLETTSSTSAMSNSSNACITKVTTENLKCDILSEHSYATIPLTSSQSNTSDNTVQAATKIHPSSELETCRCDSSSSDEDDRDNQMTETPVEKDETTVAKSTAIDISIDKFNKICRMCFSEKEIKPFFKLLFEGVQFYEIYREITGLQIQNEDNLPHHICLSCIEKVIELYLFIQKCYKSEEKLHNIWRKVAIDMTTVNQEINANCERDSENEQKMCEESDFNVDNTKIEDISLQSAFTSLTNNVPEYKTETERIEKINSVRMKFVRNFNKLQPIKKSLKLNGPPYVCEKCNNSYDNIVEFKRHKKSSKCRLCLYSCNVCDRKFISRPKLKSHMVTHTKEKPHMCDICGSRFSLLCNLVRHKRRHTGERSFSCETCGKSFTRNLTKRIHMRLHTGEKPYACSYCEMRFVSISGLTTHTKKHAKGEQITTRDRYNYKSCLCSICGKIFVSSAQLRTHSVIHTGIKPYSCKICKKSFPYKSTLKVHSVVHNGERAHLCTICSKSFNQRGHLRRHIRSHLGEKPYSCQFCGKMFTCSGNLKVHKRLHTGETPYHCPVCNKGFPHSSSMKKHAKIHT